jgi:phage-related protein
VATRKLEVVITGDASSLDRALGKTEKQGQSFAKSMGKAGVAGAIVGLGFAVKAGVSEFLDAQKVMAQTEAVLKSTGSAANVTADQVSDLAESLMKKSGVDDEAIQSGENMLLTFTKIRNETGKGNDIFNQATKATLDLSVAMGKDMQSSAVLVGKALNDPIKGMSALSRAGIQFTDDQKKMIKEMVASGDAMGAQKVILKELETQFGGSAEAAGKTFSGQMNIAKQTALNFAGDIVEKLIPVLTDLVAFIRTNWPKIREIIENVTNDIRALWKQWGDEIMAVVRFVFPVVQKMIENTLKIIQGIVDVVMGVLTGDWRRAWEGIKGIVEGVWAAIKLMVETAGTVLKTAALAVGTKIKDGVIDGVKGLAGAVWDLVKLIWEKYLEMGEAIRGWGRSVGTWIKDAVVDGLKGIGNAAWDAINNISERIFEFEKQILGWGRSIAFAIKDGIVDGLKGLGNLIWNKIKDAWNYAKEQMKTLGGLIGDAGDPNFNPFIVPPTANREPISGAVDLMGARPELMPYAQAAAGYGLSVTSGLRPGAITANGTPSDHGIGKALDVAGSASGMAGFFRSLIGNPAVKQAFYDPLGSIFGGRQSPYIEGGHNDHVHVATYDKGGVLRPGWTLAHNGTGRNEYVSRGAGGLVINIMAPIANPRETARAIYNEIKALDRTQTGGRVLASNPVLR